MRASAVFNALVMKVTAISHKLQTMILPQELVKKRI